MRDVLDEIKPVPKQPDEGRMTQERVIPEPCSRMPPAQALVLCHMSEMMTASAAANSCKRVLSIFVRNCAIETSRSIL